MIRHCNGGVYDTVTKTFFLVKQRGLGSNVFSADSFEGFNRTKKWLFICDSLFDKTPNCSHCCDFISTSYNPFFIIILFLRCPPVFLGESCSAITLATYSTKTIYLPNVNCNAPSKKHQLCLYYQPIIDIKTEKCIGAEALLRWLW